MIYLFFAAKYKLGLNWDWNFLQSSNNIQSSRDEILAVPRFHIENSGIT